MLFERTCDLLLARITAATRLLTPGVYERLVHEDVSAGDCRLGTETVVRGEVLKRPFSGLTAVANWTSHLHLDSLNCREGGSVVSCTCYSVKAIAHQVEMIDLIWKVQRFCVTH